MRNLISDSEYLKVLLEDSKRIRFFLGFLYWLNSVLIPFLVLISDVFVDFVAVLGLRWCFWKTQREADFFLVSLLVELCFDFISSTHFGCF